MSKYDFGTQIVQGSSMEWALKKIRPNSTVLELGPANGNLTRHMQAIGCVVDIVEVDAEAGAQAAEFARNSCVGIGIGDLQTGEWYKALQTNRYDFVIILDVLEHLTKGHEVLENVRELLKEDGELLVSVPNITHNAVIVELCKNRFQYNKLGLLDDTHLHFFSHEGITELMTRSGFFVEKEEARQVAVENTELGVSLEELPQDVSAYLRTRPEGEIYQFLFTAVKRDVNTVKMQYCPLDKDGYHFVAFASNDTQIVCEKVIDRLDKYAVVFSIPACETSQIIRIDPIDANCILQSVAVYAITDVEEKLSIDACSGVVKSNRMYFTDADPRINVTVKPRVGKVRFEATYLSVDSKALEMVGELIGAAPVNCIEEKKDESECNSNAENKLVSVIMPCYNDGAYIQEAIDSVLAQSYANIEIQVIDDGSDDKATSAILTQLPQKSNRIHILSTPHLGPAEARNYGIEKSAGEYILPLDADDRICCDYVEKATKILDEDSTVGAVYCKGELFGAKSGPWDLPDYSFKEMLLDNVVFVTALFRKSDWKRIGGFNTKMTHGMEDYDFWISMLEINKKIVQIPETLFYYRIKDSSRTTRFQGDAEQVKQTYEQIYINHKSFFDSHSAEVISALRGALIDHIFLCKQMKEQVAFVQKVKRVPVIGRLLQVAYHIIMRWRS